MESLSTEKYNELRYEQMPWIEKFRPHRIQNIILTKELRNKMESFIKSKSIPNIIFSGTPGNGKTTTIKCLAYEIYEKHFKDCVLVLNASDERGIKSRKVIDFCRTKTNFTSEDKTNICSHKLIILDEADNMMENAQHQLNTMMEKYKDTIRFAFTCNNSADIIEAIQSRCISLDYTRLTQNQIIERMIDICTIEKFKYEKNAIDFIAELSRGDMREAINKLQLVYVKFGLINYKGVESICDFPQPFLIKNMFHNCLKGSSGLVEAIKILITLKNEGYSDSDIIIGMNYTIKSDLCNDISSNIKILMLNKISNATYSISEGSNNKLQLPSCLAEMSQIKI
jgi:replication factor C subunit 2/4